jgi:uncharacterized protein with PQ loop repeat
MITLSALESYTSYAKNAHASGLSIEDIDKAMAEQGVDEYSRSLVTNQLKTALGAQAQVASGAMSMGVRKRTLRSIFINRGIYIVAAVEPLGVIPQLYTIFSRRDASHVSILTWSSFVLFDLVWLWYGWEAKQKPLIISSAIFTLLELLVVIGAVAFRGYW